MYFKIKKNSVTGQKLQTVLDKITQAREAQKTLAEKYHVVQWRGSSLTIEGGFSSVIFEPGFKPDPKVWKNVYDSDDEFMPKLSSKEGKKIKAEFINLPLVYNTELNDIFKIKNALFGHPGFYFKNDEYFGIYAKDNCEMTIPEDTTEITMTEFKKLFPSYTPGR